MASGSTSNYSLSYPLSTDPIALHTDMQALAEDVDTQLGSFSASVSPSTDDAIVRFDGTTGTLQNSGVTIDDSDNVVVPGNLEVNGTFFAVDSTSTANLVLDAGGTGDSGIYLYESGASRWIINRDDDDGNDLKIYSDGAAANVLTFDYTTGDATFLNDVTVGGFLSAESQITATGGPIRVDRTGDSAAAELRIDADSGQHSRIQLRTGTSARFVLGKDSSTESGSDAGSDFVLGRYSDAGALLGTALTITRANGNATFEADVTVGGDLELTSGGPTITQGTGTPSGAVTEPQGSLFHQTDDAYDALWWNHDGGTGWTGVVGTRETSSITNGIATYNGTSGRLLRDAVATCDGSGNIVTTGSITASSKSFDIPHPSKEDHRLRHGSLEGPEHAVYIRGKADSSVITLPDYWIDLVDEYSITAQLTPIGSHQNLFVESVDAASVTIGGVGGEFFYFIQATRTDVAPLEVEYEHSL